MTGVTSNPAAASPPPAPALTPLAHHDPPRVAGFWLDARVAAAASGVAYTAHDDAGTPVLLIALSQGASADAAARDRLAGAVNKLDLDTVLARGGQGQDTGRLAGKFRPEADAPAASGRVPLAPWVALAYDGTPAAAAEARRLLAEVDLSRLAAQGAASGPGYEHYWIEQAQPGPWRLWPLPWPGRTDRSGWLSILASWVLMLLLACLAVLIAILLFQNSPQQQPPPPVPTSASGTGSPTSASGSASPTESPSGSGSPSESPSGSGRPTPTNSKL